MTVNHDDITAAEIDAELAKNGVPAITIDRGAREATRELARAILRNEHTDDIDTDRALYLAASSVARVLYIAATAPPSLNTIPQVTFIAPPTVREQSELDDVLDRLIGDPHPTARKAVRR